MSKCRGYCKMWFIGLLLMAVFMAGCGGGSSSSDGGYWGGGDGGGSNVSTTAPTVTFIDPAQSETGVAINRKIAANFSKDMDPATINSTTFTVAGLGGSAVSGTVTLVGRVATFTPAANLAVNTQYTATITTGAKDTAGNALAQKYMWSFTTGAAPDTTAPTVTFTAPALGETGVAINRKIAATFSKTMDPLTITNTTFTVTGPNSTPVPGTVTYFGLVATFTPTSNLAISTAYTATVTTGVKDLAGNALAANYAWSFTTGAAPDTTPPTITQVNPANGDAGVAINRKVAATFSKVMDPTTTTNLTFTVTGPGTTPVAGTVAYVGLVATFTPTANLAIYTTYTATVTTGVKDLAGNAMAANYTWTFTTGAAPDTTPPTVTLVSPANGATGILTSTTITATFSKDMDPTTITNIIFTVAGVPGTVLYNPLTRMATFTPGSALANSTTYTATITTGAKDLAQNAMAANYVWSFTTSAAAPGPISPLGPKIITFGSFGGGAGMTNQGLLTVINGDIGTSGTASLMTGFHQAPVAPGGIDFTVTPLNNGLVNGIIYASNTVPAFDPAAATEARAAYTSLQPAAMPGGIHLGTNQLGGLTLPPGVYQSEDGTYQITGKDLTLNGTATDVWVFQMATSLTVGGPGAAFPQSVKLTGGALAKNVYWQVGSAATINAGGGGTMEGTIIAEAGCSFSTAGNTTIVTLNGRAIGLNASVTLVNTVINIP